VFSYGTLRRDDASHRRSDITLASGVSAWVYVATESRDSA
jgi:hypothetical protein